ncbi:MAG: sensor histidine kinase, partial [Clostridia bacterium]|nr:sensor histidine kinase [Clostridia bacterium]
ITANIALEYKFTLAQQFIENQKAAYENLYTGQQEVRKIRHDLQNELAGILHQLENNQMEETITHIKDKLNLLESNKKNLFSGNNAMDTLLNSKQKIAEAKGIAIETNLQIKSILPIDTIDLFILLGNGLDNAIEATHNVTKHAKVITVSVKSQGESLLIVINNPVDDIVDVTRLISSKPDFDNHGFGIIQMKKLTKKYNGDVFFECTKEQFKTTILTNDRRISNGTQRIGKSY